MKSPKYKYEDKVKFKGKNYTTKKTEVLHGLVYIIDRGGTWDNGNNEPSYDVYVESCNCLYKHITESDISFEDGSYEQLVIDLDNKKG